MTYEFLNKITYPFSRINWHIFIATIRRETIYWSIQRLVAGIYIEVEAFSPIAQIWREVQVNLKVWNSLILIDFRTRYIV
jgi:hypothetical protein